MSDQVASDYLESAGNSAEGFFKNRLPDSSSEQLGNQSMVDNSNSYGKRNRNKRKITQVGFERANWDLAMEIKQEQSNQYMNGEKVSYCIGVDHFKNYGPGIYLFFLFIKRAILLFCIMTVIDLIPLIYNYVNGDGFDASISSFQIFVIKSMTGNHSSEGNSSGDGKRDKLLTAIPDMINTVIFLIFYFYWSRAYKKQAKELRYSIKYPSDQTIEVLKFPKGVDEAAVKTFFEKFGTVKQVAGVRNYEQMISLSKEAYENCLKIKQHRLMVIAEGKQEDEEYVAKIEQKNDEILEKLNTIQQQSEHEIIKFYVVFEQQGIKEEILKMYEPFQGKCYSIGCCKGDKVPEPQLFLDDQIPKIKSCQVQPGGLMWQNMHITWKSRWIRYLIQSILLLIIIIVAFIIISLLNITTPSTSTDQEYLQHDFQSIQNETEIPIRVSWCINNDLQTAEEQDFCDEYLKYYYKKIAITVLISLSIVVIKQIIKAIVIGIAKFQRYKNHTELATNILTNLMITYICTTVLITFLLQANIFGISFKKFVKIFLNDNNLLDNADSMNEYDDFTSDWYKDIGYQIWLNWLILSLIPHTVMPLYHCFRQKLGNFMGKKQLLQKYMLQWTQAEQFEIWDNYAEVMMIIFVGFAFSGGIPFMIPLSLVGLATRYLYYKFAFIRYCRIPKAYTTAMTQRILGILPIIIIVHLLFSIWMLGVEDIFGVSNAGFLDKWVNNASNNAEKQLALIIKKLAATWYLTVLLGLVILIFVLKKIFVDLLSRIFKKEDQEFEKSKIKSNNEDSEKRKPSPMIKEEKMEINAGNLSINDEIVENRTQKNIKKTQVSLTTSYKIQNNPDYLPILAIMKSSQAKKVLKQTMGKSQKQLALQNQQRNMNSGDINNGMKSSV